MIIMLGGIKGGTGKTNIAVNVAASLAEKGSDVLLLDIDPQASSYKWVERREENYPEFPRISKAQASGRTIDTVKDMAGRFEHIIIDAGGFASDAMKSAMLATQKLYSPLQASQSDVETVSAMLNLVKDVKSLNDRLEANFILSRVSTHSAVTEGDDVSEVLKNIDEFKLSETRIYDRKVYRDAFIEGVGVNEMTNNKAQVEIENLIQEIICG